MATTAAAGAGAATADELSFASAHDSTPSIAGGSGSNTTITPPLPPLAPTQSSSAQHDRQHNPWADFSLASSMNESSGGGLKILDIRRTKTDRRRPKGAQRSGPEQEAPMGELAQSHSELTSDNDYLTDELANWQSQVRHQQARNSTNPSPALASGQQFQQQQQRQQSGDTLSSYESDYDLLVYLGETETEDIVDTERSLDYQDQTWRQSICGGASLAPTIDESLSELLSTGGGVGQHNLSGSATPQSSRTPLDSISGTNYNYNPSPIPGKQRQQHQQQQQQPLASANFAGLELDDFYSLWTPDSTLNPLYKNSNNNNNRLKNSHLASSATLPSRQPDSEALTTRPGANYGAPQTSSGTTTGGRKQQSSTHKQRPHTEASSSKLVTKKSAASSRGERGPDDIKSATDQLERLFESSRDFSSATRKGPPADSVVPPQERRFVSDIRQQTPGGKGGGQQQWASIECLAASEQPTAGTSNKFNHGQSYGNLEEAAAAMERAAKRQRHPSQKRRDDELDAWNGDSVDELDRLLAEMNQSLDLDSLARYDPYKGKPPPPSAPSLTSSQSLSQSSSKAPPPGTREIRRLAAQNQPQQAGVKVVRQAPSRAEQLNYSTPAEQRPAPARPAGPVSNGNESSILDEYDGASKMLELMISEQLAGATSGGGFQEPPPVSKQRQRAGSTQDNKKRHDVEEAAATKNVPAVARGPAAADSRGGAAVTLKLPDQGAASHDVLVAGTRGQLATVEESSRAASQKQRSIEGGGANQVGRIVTLRPVSASSSTDSSTSTTTASAPPRPPSPDYSDIAVPPPPLPLHRDRPFASSDDNERQVIKLEAAQLPASVSSSSDEDEDKAGARGRNGSGRADQDNSASHSKMIDNMKRRTLSSMRNVRRKFNDLLGDQSHAPPEQPAPAPAPAPAPSSSKKDSQALVQPSDAGASAVASETTDSFPAESVVRQSRQRQRGAPRQGLASKDSEQQQRPTDKGKQSLGQQLRGRLSRSKSRFSQLLDNGAELFTRRRRAQSTPNEGGRQQLSASMISAPIRAADPIEQQQNSLLLFQPSDIARNSPSDSRPPGAVAARTETSRDRAFDSSLERHLMASLDAPKLAASGASGAETSSPEPSPTTRARTKSSSSTSDLSGLDTATGGGSKPLARFNLSPLTRSAARVSLKRRQKANKTSSESAQQATTTGAGGTSDSTKLRGEPASSASLPAGGEATAATKSHSTSKPLDLIAPLKRLGRGYLSRSSAASGAKAERPSSSSLGHVEDLDSMKVSSSSMGAGKGKQRSAASKSPGPVRQHSPGSSSFEAPIAPKRATTDDYFGLVSPIKATSGAEQPLSSVHMRIEMGPRVRPASALNTASVPPPVGSHSPIVAARKRSQSFRASGGKSFSVNAEADDSGSELQDKPKRGSASGGRQKAVSFHNLTTGAAGATPLNQRRQLSPASPNSFRPTSTTPSGGQAQLDAQEASGAAPLRPKHSIDSLVHTHEGATSGPLVTPIHPIGASAHKQQDEKAAIRLAGASGQSKTEDCKQNTTGPSGRSLFGEIRAKCSELLPSKSKPPPSAPVRPPRQRNRHQRQSAETLRRSRSLAAPRGGDGLDQALGATTSESPELRDRSQRGATLSSPRDNPRKQQASGGKQRLVELAQQLKNTASDFFNAHPHSQKPTTSGPSSSKVATRVPVPSDQATEVRRLHTTTAADSQRHQTSKSSLNRPFFGAIDEPQSEHDLCQWRPIIQPSTGSKEQTREPTSTSSGQFQLRLRKDQTRDNQIKAQVSNDTDSTCWDSSGDGSGSGASQADESSPGRSSAAKDGAKLADGNRAEPSTTRLHGAAVASKQVPAAAADVAAVANISKNGNESSSALSRNKRQEFESAGKQTRQLVVVNSGGATAKALDEMRAVGKHGNEHSLGLVDCSSLELAKPNERSNNDKNYDDDDDEAGPTRLHEAASRQRSRTAPNTGSTAAAAIKPPPLDDKPEVARLSHGGERATSGGGKHAYGCQIGASSKQYETDARRAGEREQAFSMASVEKDSRGSRIAFNSRAADWSKRDKEIEGRGDNFRIGHNKAAPQVSIANNRQQDSTRHATTIGQTQLQANKQKRDNNNNNNSSNNCEGAEARDRVSSTAADESLLLKGQFKFNENLPTPAEVFNGRAAPERSEASKLPVAMTPPAISIASSTRRARPEESAKELLNRPAATTTSANSSKPIAPLKRYQLNLSTTTTTAAADRKRTAQATDRQDKTPKVLNDKEGIKRAQEQQEDESAEEKRLSIYENVSVHEAAPQVPAIKIDSPPDTKSPKLLDSSAQSELLCLRARTGQPPPAPKPNDLSRLAEPPKPSRFLLASRRNYNNQSNDNDNDDELDDWSVGPLDDAWFERALPRILQKIQTKASAANQQPIAIKPKLTNKPIERLVQGLNSGQDPAGVRSTQIGYEEQQEQQHKAAVASVVGNDLAGQQTESGARISWRPERQLVPATGIYHEPEDDLMQVVSMRQSGDEQLQGHEKARQGPSARGKFGGALRRQQASTEVKDFDQLLDLVNSCRASIDYDDDDDDDEDSFDCAMASRRLLANKFNQQQASSGGPQRELRRESGGGRPPLAAEAEHKRKVSVKQKVAAYQTTAAGGKAPEEEPSGSMRPQVSGPGSLVRRLAKNFDQTIQEQPAAVSGRLGRQSPTNNNNSNNMGRLAGTSAGSGTGQPEAQVVGGGQLRAAYKATPSNRPREPSLRGLASFELDDPKSDSTWFDAKSVELLDDVEVAELLREFCADDKSAGDSNHLAATSGGEPARKQQQAAARLAEGGDSTANSTTTDTQYLSVAEDKEPASLSVSFEDDAGRKDTPSCSDTNNNRRRRARAGRDGNGDDGDDDDDDATLNDEQTLNEDENDLIEATDELAALDEDESLYASAAGSNQEALQEHHQAQHAPSDWQGAASSQGSKGNNHKVTSLTNAFIASAACDTSACSAHGSASAPASNLSCCSCKTTVDETRNVASLLLSPVDEFEARNLNSGEAIKIACESEQVRRHCRSRRSSVEVDATTTTTTTNTTKAATTTTTECFVVESATKTPTIVACDQLASYKTIDPSNQFNRHNNHDKSACNYYRSSSCPGSCFYSPAAASQSNVNNNSANIETTSATITNEIEAATNPQSAQQPIEFDTNLPVISSSLPQTTTIITTTTTTTAKPLQQQQQQQTATAEGDQKLEESHPGAVSGKGAASGQGSQDEQQLQEEPTNRVRQEGSSSLVGASCGRGPTLTASMLSVSSLKSQAPSSSSTQSLNRLLRSGNFGATVRDKAAKKCSKLYDDIEKLLFVRTKDVVQQQQQQPKPPRPSSDRLEHPVKPVASVRRLSDDTGLATRVASSLDASSGNGNDCDEDEDISNCNDDCNDNYDRDSMATTSDRSSWRDNDQISLSSSSLSSEALQPEIKQRKNLQMLYNIVNEICSSEEKFVDTIKLLNVDFRQHVYASIVSGPSGQTAASASGSHQQLNQTTTSSSSKTAQDATSSSSVAASRSQQQQQQSLFQQAPYDCIGTILKHLPQLQALNENLLGELKRARDQWPKTQKISHVLVKIGPFLKHYSSYIRDFELIQGQFNDNLKKYPHFGELMRQFERVEQHKCNNLSIQHHLLKPIQRIPQYRLLLQQYLHHLKPDDPDYEDTISALEVVSRVAEHANQSLSEGANFAKLLALQAKIVGAKQRRNIIQPGRLFIKEGELSKVCRKQVQQRYFVLLNDALLYMKQIQASDLLYLKYELPLDDCQVELPGQVVAAGEAEAEGDTSMTGSAGQQEPLPANEAANAPQQQQKRNKEAGECEFNVRTTVRSMALVAKSRQERDDWLEALKRTIEEHNAKRRSFAAHNKLRGEQQEQQQQPNQQVTATNCPRIGGGSDDDTMLIGRQAPIWTPDSRVARCQLCTSNFTALFRRHHCRACGRVVCSACSNSRAPLIYLKCKAARVCDQCYDQLRANLHLYYLPSSQIDEQDLRRLDEHFKHVLLKGHFVKHVIGSSWPSTGSSGGSGSGTKPGKHHKHHRDRDNSHCKSESGKPR